MPQTIGVDVLDVLERCTTDGTALRLPDETLDRKLYVAVNKALEASGGKWDRRTRAHQFEGEAAPVLDQLLTTGEYVDERQEFQAFYTPPELAVEVLSLAEISSNHDVLEPSAGGGALAIPAAATGANVIAVDLRPMPWADSIDNVHPLICDFLDPIGPAPAYDRVVMNPPFARQADMIHVTRAFAFLKPGGLLVAIMSPAWQWRTSKIAQDFRDPLGRQRRHRRRGRGRDVQSVRDHDRYDHHHHEEPPVTDPSRYARGVRPRPRRPWSAIVPVAPSTIEPLTIDLLRSIRVTGRDRHGVPDGGRTILRRRRREFGESARHQRRVRQRLVRSVS